jgi:hypothetical protein
MLRQLAASAVCRGKSKSGSLRYTKIYIIGGEFRAHWVRNIERNARVRVRIENRRFEATARVLDQRNDARLYRAVCDLMHGKYGGTMVGRSRSRLTTIDRHSEQSLHNAACPKRPTPFRAYCAWQITGNTNVRYSAKRSPPQFRLFQAQDDAERPHNTHPGLYLYRPVLSAYSS